VLEPFPHYVACRLKWLTHRRRKRRRRLPGLRDRASVYSLADELAGDLHLDGTLDLVLTAPSKVKSWFLPISRSHQLILTYGLRTGRRFGEEAAIQRCSLAVDSRSIGGGGGV
jgi:hypothetical protein